jgi:tRNA pseudouridine55 synthase
MATAKRYRTVIDLSAFTSTDDCEGEREEVAVATPPAIGAIRDALVRFTGRQRQRPPAFSAVKVGGRRAYALARRGKTPEIAEREVVVHGIELVEYAWPLLAIDVHCTKGFYVRSLARDLGRALGTGGHCRSIRRTAVGPFTIAMAVAVDRVPDPLGAEDLISAERALEMVAECSRR